MTAKVYNIDDARKRLIERMVKKYSGNVTHVSPIFCNCYGCIVRRKWLHLDSYR